MCTNGNPRRTTNAGYLVTSVALIVPLLDEATESVINGVNQQDRLAQVAADGAFTLKLNGEVNVIVDTGSVGSGQFEKHILGVFWLWNDETQDQSGIQLVRLGVQVFPTLP